MLIPSIDALGIEVDEESGKIKRITADGLLYQSHVRVGWRLKSMNGETYTAARVEEAVVAGCDVTFVMEKDTPTQEQLEVLHRVKDRVTEEFKRDRDQTPKGHSGEGSEPLRALIHGIPGTG